MEIGSWGALVFEVNADKALTYSEITQDTSGRWATHDVINSAPLSEFLGPGQDEAEIKIFLTRALGVDPRTEYDTVRSMVRNGENFPLILQGRPLSGNLWYLDGIGSVSTRFAAGKGDILWMELTCRFKEYN